MTDWNSYNKKNKRDPRMSVFWVQKTLQHIVKKQPNASKMAVLDYGCGYFDLGFALQNMGHCVDGYDPYAPGIEYANQQKSSLSPSVISASLKDIKKNHYDLIVLNGVIQYFESCDELLEKLILFRSFLRAGGEILLVDVVHPQTNLWFDALQNLVVATQNGLFSPMFWHLAKASTNRVDKKLLRVSFEEIERIARKAHYQKCVVLAENLSPSKQRFSCLIS